MSDVHPTNEFPAQQPPPGFGPVNGPVGGPPNRPGNPEGPRTSRRLTIVLIAAIVVVLGAGIGVAFAVGTDDGGGKAQAGASSSAPARGGAQQGKQGKQGKNAKKGKHNVARGTITAESGSTWTLKTLQGDTVQVTITSATKFGNNADPGTKSDYPVGKKVVVAGKKTDVIEGSVTAVRVRDLPDHSGGKQKQQPAPSSSPS